MAITIYRGTTPTLRCILPAELSKLKIAEVWMSFKFRDRNTLQADFIDYVFSKGQLTVSDNIITLAMSQDDTLRFKPKDYRLDIRILLGDGSAIALKQKKMVHIVDVLKDGRIDSKDAPQNRIIPVILSDSNSEEFKGLFNEAQQTFNAELDSTIQVTSASNYNELENRPQINGVTLEGNKTLEDLGFYALLSDQVQDIWDEL